MLLAGYETRPEDSNTFLRGRLTRANRYEESRETIETTREVHQWTFASLSFYPSVPFPSLVYANTVSSSRRRVEMSYRHFVRNTAPRPMTVSRRPVSYK